MKYLLFSILFLSATVGDIFAQNASDYFPTQLDYNWFFEIKMLDSLTIRFRAAQGSGAIHIPVKKLS